MNKTKHWSNTEERGSLLGMRFLFAVYRLLGRKLLWIFLFPVVFFIYLTGGTARKASHQFFSKLYKYQNSSNRPSFINGLKHFCSFADSTFDKVDAWTGRINPSQIIYENEDAFNELVAKKQGAVFIASHLGNMEVCRALGKNRQEVIINVLVFTENAVKFNHMLNSINPSVNVNLIQVSSVNPGLAMELKDKVDNGEMVVIVGDRTSTTVSERSVYADFLGEPAPFATGPFILASLLECPVYWLFCLKEDSHFRVIFEFIDEKIVMPRKERKQVLQRLITDYAGSLGNYASRYPHQWFNFFDFWQRDEQLERRG